MLVGELKQITLNVERSLCCCVGRFVLPGKTDEQRTLAHN